jgi:hypothetical protein
MPEQQNTPSNNVLVVLNGYKNLTATEKTQFTEEINKYIKAEQRDKLIMEANFSKAASSTGPVGHGKCSCCGR